MNKNNDYEFFGRKETFCEKIGRWTGSAIALIFAILVTLVLAIWAAKIVMWLV